MMPMTAALALTRKTATMPMAIAPRIGRNGMNPPGSFGAQSIREKRLRNDGNVPRMLIWVLIMFMPKKSMPNPKTALPQPCRLRFFVNVIRMKPMAMAGSARPLRLNEISWAVMVVPMFAPKMMPMACTRFSNPALMKPSTMMVVAALDWMTAVTKAPAITPRIEFFEKNWSTCCIFSPAMFWRPRLRRSMPKIRNAMPPIMLMHTENMLIPSRRASSARM